jgi:hypothetical protein
MGINSIPASQKFQETWENNEPKGQIYIYDIILKPTEQVQRWKVRFDLATGTVFKTDLGLHSTEGGTAYIE